MTLPSNQWGDDVDALRNTGYVDNIGLSDKNVEPRCHSKCVSQSIKLLQSVFRRAYELDVNNDFQGVVVQCLPIVSSQTPYSSKASLIGFAICFATLCSCIELQPRVS